MSAPPYLKPREDILSVTRFPCTLNSGLVLSQVNEGSSESRPVGNAREQELGGLVQFVVETLLTHIQDIGNVRHSQEVLHIVQPVGLGISVSELRINFGFAEGFTSHLKVADKVILLACSIGNLDEFVKVRWVPSLNVRV